MMTHRKKAHPLSQSCKEAILWQAAGILAERPETGFAYVYGSFLDDTPCHDIDIGIYALNRDSTPNPLWLAVEIGKEIERSLRLPVDVRIINDAPLFFLLSIIKGRLLYDRIPEVRQQIMADLMRRYFGISPILAHTTKEAFAP